MTAFDLTGKKAFVTGASRGIGRVIAVALAAAGADVAIAARSQDGLAETAREVTDLGRKAFAFPLDVTRQEDVTAAVHEAIRLLGQLDIVVNNAGGMNFMVPFLDMRISGWEKVLRQNLDSTIYVCQAAGPHMRERGRGTVINVASVAGMSGAPGLTPYGAAKAAVISVTKTLAVEWAPVRDPGERAVPGLDRHRPEPEPVTATGRDRACRAYRRERPDAGRTLGRQRGHGRPRRRVHWPSDRLRRT